MAGELDPRPGQPHSASMPFVFDTLAAADALRDAGMEPGQARAVATQLRVAAGAGDAVTRPELEAALARLKTDLMERMAEGEGALRTHSTEGDQSLRAQLAENDQSLRERIAEVERMLLKRIAEVERMLLDRIAESERRYAALLWRLFGGIVATAGVAVAAARLLPVVTVVG